VDTRFALIAPASASPAVVESTRELMAGVLKDPVFRVQLLEGGFHAIDDPHEQFVKAVAESAKHYRQLVQQAGLV
jgi:tripartite-type tricarboxylate transporter receptor subunit TctC